MAQTPQPIPIQRIVNIKSLFVVLIIRKPLFRLQKYSINLIFATISQFFLLPGIVVLFEKNQKVLSPNLPPILGDFISYFLWRRERSKETSTLTKPSPIWEGCNCLRGQAALRQSFCMALRLSPFGFAMVVYIPACAAPWKGAHEPQERDTHRRRKCLLSGLVFLSELGFLFGLAFYQD